MRSCKFFYSRILGITIRVQMKHLSIPANQTSINFDNIFTGALPGLVIVGLDSDADLAGN